MDDIDYNVSFFSKQQKKLESEFDEFEKFSLGELSQRDLESLQKYSFTYRDNGTVILKRADLQFLKKKTKGKIRKFIGREKELTNFLKKMMNI